MTRSTKIAIVAFVLLIAAALVLSSRGSMLNMPRGSTDTVFSPAHDTSGLPVLSDHMPDFAGISQWWNTPNNQPLTPDGLKGKVVLVDFWTYSCINCLRTLPFLKGLQDQYASKGLVIVGVHTPEFAFEGDPANVGQAIKNLGITYPVALDADYGTWNAYQNQYWPAEYLFDQSGRLRHTQFGEGDYDQTEQAIRSLLAENTAAANLGPMTKPIQTPDFNMIGTNETYFGLARGDAFANTQQPSTTPASYVPVHSLPDNEWTAGGQWVFQDQYAEALAVGDTFAFSVQASQLHLVLASSDQKNKTIEVSVDGGAPTTFTINEPQLYTVAKFPNGGRHTVTVRLRDAAIRFYSATFS